MRSINMTTCRRILKSQVCFGCATLLESVLIILIQNVIFVDQTSFALAENARMVIDELVRQMTKGRQQFDRNGTNARKGKVHERLLKAMLGDPYFQMAPPKSTGRERFGREFVIGLIATGVKFEDLIATAAELTAQTVAATVPPGTEVIASGGGVHNRWLMQRLAQLLPEGSALTTSKEYGIHPDAKEAIAFAVLAYQYAQKQPGNLPSVTGARRPVLLGKDSPA